MPVPRGTYYRFRRMPNDPNRKQRLAFSPSGEVVEVKNYVKKDGTFVPEHTRRKRR